MKITFEPIGIIKTDFRSKDQAPVQGVFCGTATGRVVLHPEYAAGLQDIEDFSHLILLYHFHEAGEVQLVRRPFLDDVEHGIFATRHPCRPNGIGISTVQLMSRNGNILEVAGIDVLDGTPLIDIKPYVPRFDSYPDAVEGWFAGKEERQKPAGRE